MGRTLYFDDTSENITNRNYQPLRKTCNQPSNVGKRGSTLGTPPTSNCFSNPPDTFV